MSELAILREHGRDHHCEIAPGLICYITLTLTELPDWRTVGTLG